MHSQPWYTLHWPVIPKAIAKIIWGGLKPHFTDAEHDGQRCEVTTGSGVGTIINTLLFVNKLTGGRSCNSQKVIQLKSGRTEIWAGRIRSQPSLLHSGSVCSSALSPCYWLWGNLWMQHCDWDRCRRSQRTLAQELTTWQLCVFWANCSTSQSLFPQ